MNRTLVMNAGSSSVKFALFDQQIAEVVTGSVTEIGGASRLKIGVSVRDLVLLDHAAAVGACLQALAEIGHGVETLTAAAHRVVHGGAALVAPCRITPEVLAAIEACVPLAPLHNPANLAAISALAEIAPDLPQFASFDTAFHASTPEVAVRYALPAQAEAFGLRRYGFHGLSYASLARRLPTVAGGMPERVLALHLGNGASICAISQGRAVASSMGYSPLSGLTMGTRTGDIDGNAVLRLAEIYGVEAAGRMLNRESGLVGLAGVSDMRVLLASDDPRAAFAVDHFCYWAARHCGSLMAAMGGLDAVVFTGGIGENAAPIRAKIMEQLAWSGLSYDTVANATGAEELHSMGSTVRAWILDAQEEAQIAAEAMAVMEDAR